jgi:hypothetical protein
MGTRNNIHTESAMNIGEYPKLGPGKVESLGYESDISHLEYSVNIHLKNA